MEDTDSQWEPNQEFLSIMMDMGISKIAAEYALYYTGNNSVETATSFVFDNPDIDQMAQGLNLAKGRKETAPKSKGDSSTDEHTSSDEDSCFKMVFIVNCSLNMGVGKIATQVAHASLGLYRKIQKQEDVKYWERNGEKKVVLKGENHLHLQNLQDTAEVNEVISYLVCDAGRTQVPANSVTVLGLFGSEQEVNQISGDLNLL